MYIMKKNILCFILSLPILLGNDLLQLKNGQITDTNNQPVFLKGCNTGNWLMLEMWMLNYAGKGIEDQHEFIETLEHRFGKEEAEKLMDIYRSHWIKESDFDIIKSFGMNTVRLPFDYKLLMDSDKKPFKLKTDAWEWLDLAIKIAKEKGLYVILDMHGAPGRQSGMDHSGRVGYNKLWSIKSFQDQTAWLWKEISNRYKNETTIAAYDLLNEPWGSSEKNLKKIVLKCYKEIRKNDDNHIVIFPGHTSGIDFYRNIKSVKLSNVIYTMHFYPGFFGWGSATPYVHAEFLLEGLPNWVSRMEEFNSPLLIGEFNVVLKNAGGGEMMRRYYDFYESLYWPATMWSYKVLDATGGVGDGTWGMVTNANDISYVDLKTATYNEIREWFISFGDLEIAIDKDLKYWLTTKEEPATLDDLPPKPPAMVKAPNLDSMPELWNVIDIGRPLKGGQKIEKSEWTFFGGGNDIWSTNDQFRFAYQKLNDDFSISIKVDSLKNTHQYAKAGLMIRKSLNKNSAHGIINIFPSGNTEFGYRDKNGESMKATSGPRINWENAKLKIKKLGSRAKFFVFNDDSWTEIGELDISKWGKSFYLGIATLSHDNNQLTKAQYSEIDLRQ